ncbi:MAG: hypothetical protein R6U67_14160 [Sodalinema sp.]|uniref:hypothetical protein n=1 Tax=Sodalinema sp. TaxID=3080550 RepID=UPI00121F9D62|nr:MAG: hypothetical protein EYR95_01435 [Phormidium sp. SL48-SHIP]
MTVQMLSGSKAIGLSLITATLAAIAAIGLQGLRWQQVINQETEPVQEERRLELQLALLDQLPSLGFDNAIASWTFLQYLQYFGDEAARDQTGCRLNFAYLDQVTQRDPRFFTAYTFVPGGVSYCQGEPLKSVELLDRGLESISPDIDEQAFVLALLEALDRFLLLGDVPGAIHAYEQAADLAAETDSYADFASYYRQTAQWLRDNPDSLRARFIGWQEVYFNATDESVKERAISELENLGAQVIRQDDGSVEFRPPSQQDLNPSPRNNEGSD